jgi:perosamine synthetase
MPSDPGAQASEGISLSVPQIEGNEWAYVKECFDTGWVSSGGAFVERFEREFATRVGIANAVATSSGTAALHVALLVAGVEPDDEVLVSTLTFIAPVNAIRYVGAWPVLIDAEPDYWQMDPEKAVSFLDNECAWREGELRNRATGHRVKAILPVHVLGHPVDLDPILEAARRYGLSVIEDATESLGARYKGRTVGTLADIACFSFNGNKMITTGGGGMIVASNDARAQRARHLTTQAKADPLEYVHDEIGFNYRLTNVQAAIGCAQLEQLDRFVEAKREVAAIYEEVLREVPGITTMAESPHATSAFWMYTISVDEQHYGMDSRELLRLLGEAGVQTRPLWEPMHKSLPHRSAQACGGAVAESLYRTCLSLPCSVGLAQDQARWVARLVAEAATKGSTG